MKLLVVILFSSLIWPSPFIPGMAKKPMTVNPASVQVKVWHAKSCQSVELLTSQS